MSNALRKSERVVVVPYRPGRKWTLIFLTLLCVVGSSAAGFFYAAYKLEFWREDLLGQRDNLVEQLLTGAVKIESQQSQLAAANMSAEVDRQAAEALKIELLGRQRAIAELNEELSFYRNLMNPTAGQSGLDAYRFLVYGLEGEQLRYRVILQQLGTTQKLVSAKLGVTLVGVLAGEPTELLLKDLVAESTPWKGVLKFRYYQDSEGLFSLPQGFVPSQVKVSVGAGRKKPKIRTFDWKVLE